MIQLYEHLKHSGLEERLLLLIYLRASQINHCAYCIDMHSKDLRASGESKQRIYMLDAWREWSGYSEREARSAGMDGSGDTGYGRLRSGRGL